MSSNHGRGLTQIWAVSCYPKHWVQTEYTNPSAIRWQALKILMLEWNVIPEKLTPVFKKQSSEVKIVRFEIGSGKLLLVALAGLALRSPESLCSHSVLRVCLVIEHMNFSIFQIGKLRPSGFYSSIMIRCRQIQEQNHNTNISCSFSLCQSQHK